MPGLMCAGFCLAAHLAFAQSTTGEVDNAVEIAPVVTSSPLPIARGVQQEEPQRIDDLDGATATLPGDGAGGVTVVSPGADGPVRVVFNNRAREGETNGNAAQTDRWKEERAKRFHTAPETPPLSRTDRPGLAVPISAPETGLVQGVVLRALDKMTGRTRTHGLAVGEVKQIERLRVRLDGCREPSDGANHGTIAFLNIWDTKKADADPLFTGWMFAESPALSALDHPRYDLWVISCTTSPGDVSAARE